MASPFRTFRKYQKTLIAVAGVVLMFVFVIGDPLSQYLRGGPAPSGTGLSPNDVAVKWDNGQLTNAELNQLVIQRLVVNGFIRQVEAVGRYAAEEAGAEPQPLRVDMIVGPEKPNQNVERDVLRVHLFADAARKAGMAISDEYVVNYLLQLGRGYVSVDQIRQILAGLNVGNRRTSSDFVLDALREEMLARNYMASYLYALTTAMPEQRYRDWLNVNDRVVVEAAAISAESLLADVPEPSEAELVTFFNDYKDFQAIPDQQWGIELPPQNPGFAIPRKVAVQYLMADFNQFLAKVEDEVTDEEIEKFYEDNKDPYFIRAASVLDDSAVQGTDAASGALFEKTESENAGPDDYREPKIDLDAESGSDAAGDQPAVPDSNDESSHLPGRDNSFRLAAFADDAPVGGAVPDEASEPLDADEGAVPAAESSSDAPDEPTEKPKEFQPLDEVRDEIRREIAQAKVTQQLEQLMGNLYTELGESYTEFFGASLDAEASGKELPLPPSKLADLLPLAQKHSLVYQKTNPASMVELRDTPVGKSVRPDESNLPFYYSVFGRDVELYQPIASYDLDNNRYLAMKTEDIPGKVPTLEEVRDDVVRAWKMRKAGELALKRAEELAKQAQETGASLADTFADDKAIEVTKTDPFSYLTVGTISRDTQQVQSFRLSEPDGIVAAGPDFMEQIFNLKDGEVAAAPNHNKSIAYVVRIAEHQNSPEELQQAFLAEADNWYGVEAMARGRFQTAFRVVLADMLESVGVVWERDPDVPLREEPEADES